MPMMAIEDGPSISIDNERQNIRPPPLCDFLQFIDLLGNRLLMRLEFRNRYQFDLHRARTSRDSIYLPPLALTGGFAYD